MSNQYKIAVLPGDGIGPEIMDAAIKVLDVVQEKYGFQPAIFSCDPGINRLLKSMGFQRLFELHEEACCSLETVREIPAVGGDEAAVRQKVIDAHRTLMGLSEENRERFQDLMAVLERG